MSETAPTPAADPQPGSDPAATTGAGTQAPAGYVPQTELARVEEQRRGFQAEADRLRAELARVQAPAPAAPAPADTDSQGSPFDADAFRRSLLGEVATVTQVAAAVPALREKYPHATVADPTIFDRVSEYTSAAALEEAVKSSHDRIAAAIAAATGQTPAGDDGAAAAAAAAVTPPAGGPGTAAGDPTPEQLLQMSTAEWDELEKASPGVIDRVLRSATQ